MSQVGTTGRISEEAIMLASSAAARTERQNRPTHLVVFALAVLLASLIALFLGWRAQSAAERSLAFQKSKSGRVADRVAELLALRQKATATDSASDAKAPLSQLLPKIQDAATFTGVKDRLPPPNQPKSNPTAAGSRLKKLEYNVTDESLPALLAWIEKSLADVPGLELYRVNLRPEQQKWRMQVTFSRWEKVEGA